MAREVAIGYSNLNLSLTHTVRFGPDQYERAAEAGGYDFEAVGVEWTDIRVPTARMAAKTLADEGHIHAVHESWNERAPLDVVRQATLGREGIKALREMPVALAFPTLGKSQARLLDLSLRSGGDGLPIIIHPNGQWLGDRPPTRIRQGTDGGEFAGRRLMQPTVEWLLSRTGIDLSLPPARVADEIDLELFLSNFDGIALDLHHLRSERAGKRFKYPAALSAAIAAQGTVKEIQVSLRPDFGASESELALALQGRLTDTMIGEMLLASLSAMPKSDTPVPIITEVPASVIARAGYKDYLGAHQELTDGIRNIAHSV